MEQEALKLPQLLLARLERISADSFLAHRASGVRGSLLKMVEQLENGKQIEDHKMKQLVAYGFQILEEAARAKTITSKLKISKNK